jgi:hypothetical protein
MKPSVFSFFAGVSLNEAAGDEPLKVSSFTLEFSAANLSQSLRFEEA